jgi:superfamily II DNA or RNA helicase
MSTISVCLNSGSVKDYTRFLQIKSLPKYRIVGTTAFFPSEYAALVGMAAPKKAATEYVPARWLWDYQTAIATTAIRKKKYCVFADCGLGKQNIIFEFARHAAHATKKRVLIVCPLMVVRQAVEEATRFYGDALQLQQIAARDLAEWLTNGTGIGITNYDAITDDLPSGGLGGLILDESSMLKSHYGAWGTRLIEMGKGVEYKLAATGTPAPNDRIEYANHAVFMDAFPTVNSFLARFFINRGQTAERWALKPHALGSFYRALSDWCIFLTNPATYGWRDNCGTLPPIKIHIDDVPLTEAQRTAFMDDHGSMFVNEAGGIGSRGKIARIGKGFHNGERIDSNKTPFITRLVESWPEESTIVWCKYNQEQDDVADALPGCGNIDGSTPLEERQRIISAFKAGEIRVLVTKPKILGFGLNLQIATRHVFSGLQDSYEEFYQAVKRSNRYGSTRPLNVHIPVTEFERPMIETVLSKAARVQHDTEEQERIFREFAAIV